MKRAIFALTMAGVAALVMTLADSSYAQLPPSDPKTAALSSQSAINFRLALRELWQYQVTWTRSYIVSVISDLDDVAVVEDKLIKNQEKIGDAIKPYYGGIAGNHLAALLRKHIVIAVEIARAAKAQDAAALAIAQTKGRDNADAIANLLSKAKNPLWDKPFVKERFYAHLEFVTKQVDYRLQKNWAAEIQAYDDGLKHVLSLADLLAEGIVTQFPLKFKK